MNSAESITSCVVNYARFSGRARRGEYWWFHAIVLMICMFFYLVGGALVGETEGGIGGGALSFMFFLAAIVPSAAVGSRRLHDCDRSGWWQLLWFFPIAGWMYIIYLLIQESEPGRNRFGEPSGVLLDLRFGGGGRGRELGNQYRR